MGLHTPSVDTIDRINKITSGKSHLVHLEILSKGNMGLHRVGERKVVFRGAWGEFEFGLFVAVRVLRE